VAADAIPLAVAVLGVNVFVHDVDPPLLLTTAVAADDADAEPLEFVAVTTASIVCPTSEVWSAYVALVAPAMVEQLAPELSQSCHL
jgi:mannose/fructose/N-acetylgalactosamine-specific phosphotransferase system component IIC